MNEDSVVYINNISIILKQLKHKTLYPKSTSNVKFKKALVEKMKGDCNLWIDEIQVIENELLNL